MCVVHPWKVTSKKGKRWCKERSIKRWFFNSSPRCYQRCDWREEKQMSSFPFSLLPLSLFSHPTVDSVQPGSNRGPDGGNLIARRGQDSALSMVLRWLRPGCYHQIRQDKFQIDARDVSRPPAFGVKVPNKSPPPKPTSWQVSTNTQPWCCSLAGQRLRVGEISAGFHWRHSVEVQLKVRGCSARDSPPVESMPKVFFYGFVFFFFSHDQPSCSSSLS